MKKNKKHVKNMYLNYAKKGDLEGIQFMVKTFTNFESICVRDKMKHDIYLLAAKHGHLDIIKYLEINYKWNIETTNMFGENAFYLAVINDNTNIINYFRKSHTKLMNKSIKKILDKGILKSFYMSASKEYLWLSDYLYEN